MVVHGMKKKGNTQHCLCVYVAVFFFVVVMFVWTCGKCLLCIVYIVRTCACTVQWQWMWILCVKSAISLHTFPHTHTTRWTRKSGNGALRYIISVVGFYAKFAFIFVDVVVCCICCCPRSCCWRNTTYYLMDVEECEILAGEYNKQKHSVVGAQGFMTTWQTGKCIHDTSLGWVEFNALGP